MSKGVRRRHSREFKLGLVRRLEAGESGTALAREAGVKRTLIYRWRDAVRDGGEVALRDGGLGRPTRAEAAAMAVARGPAAKARSLAEAQRQIAELEKKVGQQQVDLDFFRGALRRIEARQPSDRPGEKTSSPRSRR